MLSTWSWEGTVLFKIQHRWYHFNSQIVKLMNISFMAFAICSMMASFSEGLLLSDKVGLDPSVLVEVIFNIYREILV